MKPLDFLYPALLAVSAFTDDATASKKSSNSVLLSSVKTLTLRKDLKTSHRRVSAVPQLKCVGGNARGLYDVDVMRCKNQGADYDDENIQWTCTASLPSEFKLGSTDVVCEGYDSSEDPYILKGSCGVNYRLVLTDLGEERYGRGGGDSWDDFKSGRPAKWVPLLFWVCFFGVIGWMLYSAFVGRRGGRAGGNLGGGWGGGGGGGGGWGGGADDPPPPYDWQPPRKPQSSSRTAWPASRGQQAWRPGFWSGAAGGAAAGYLAGQNRGGSSSRQQSGGFWGNGEGSSRPGGGGGRSGGSSSYSGSSARQESTGFGSTSRR
ncbi:MAG: hypothetical protein M1837_001692 [Sclerophora amabilis]|nr:MAG: hypothetical protein M1837_001692 [Sclerophora amabilis]